LDTLPTPTTRKIWAARGVGPRMRVLDLGSGMVDVALLAGEQSKRWALRGSKLANTGIGTMKLRRA
jgi:hypothetical protein